MPPVRSYYNWNKRPSDFQDQVEPYQKFFFICEGANTEVFYFKELINLRKQLGIHPLIDIRLLEKTDEDENLSHPKRLITFAEKEKLNPETEFDQSHDKMIVVFDTDIFKRKPDTFQEILKMAEEYHDILAVTNPAFELYLLLHYENSYETEIVPNQERILRNEKAGKRRLIDKIFSEKSGMNSKKNPQIGSLASKIDVAIEQEKKLNQDEKLCQDRLTSNIGKIISDIRNTKTPVGR